MLCESACQPLTQQEMDGVYFRIAGRGIVYDAAEAFRQSQRSEIQSCEQPWLLWRLQFLRAAMLGADYPDEKSHPFWRRPRQMTEDPGLKRGYIHDVGGPTANFRHPSCEKQLTKGVCQNRQCLFQSRVKI